VPCIVDFKSLSRNRSPLEVSIPNSKFVNLGLDKDRWHLPVAISLVGLLTFTIILLIILERPEVTRMNINEKFEVVEIMFFDAIHKPLFKY